MKAKLFMLLMAIGMLFALPSQSYAQATDENMEFETGDITENEFGPVSVDPTLIEGVLSHINKTLDLNILFDLGDVTFIIYDEQGNAYLTKQVNSSSEANVHLDLKELPSQKYIIVCVTTEGDLKAKFEL